MSFIKSKYFWLTLLALTISIGLALLLPDLLKTPKLYAYLGGGLFFLLSLILILVSRQKAAYKKRNKRKQRQPQFDQSWQTDLRNEIHGVLPKIKHLNAGRSAATNRIYIGLAPNAEEVLQSLSIPDNAVKGILPENDTEDSTGFFTWIITDSCSIALLRSNFFSSEEQKELRYLVQTLCEELDARTPAGILSFSSFCKPSELEQTTLNANINAILTESQLELPVYHAFHDLHQLAGGPESFQGLVSPIGFTFPYNAQARSGFQFANAFTGFCNTLREQFFQKSIADTRFSLPNALSLVQGIEDGKEQVAAALKLITKPGLEQEASYIRSILFTGTGASLKIDDLIIEEAASPTADVDIFSESFSGPAAFGDTTSIPVVEESSEPLLDSETTPDTAPTSTQLGAILPHLLSEKVFALLPKYRQSQMSLKGLVSFLIISGLSLLVGFSAIYSYSAGTSHEKRISQSFSAVQQRMVWNTQDEMRENLLLMLSLIHI